MSPSVVTLENVSDFGSTTSTQNGVPAVRTLLLAPPSIASHEEKLRGVLATHDRSVTDLQMLDRLSAGLVNLPEATYDLILVLTDADGTRAESSLLLNRDVFAKVVSTLKAGGKMQAQDGSLAQGSSGADAREALLAGLLPGVDGYTKADNGADDAVPLKFGSGQNKKRSAAGPPVSSVTVRQADGRDASLGMVPPAAKPAGVGFVDFSDDFDFPEDEDDDELIDEDTLLTEEDRNRPLVMPAECIPKVGKRRRACRDCTCGLAQKMAAEDAAKRRDADANLQTLKLAADDLTEVDFTVKGKVGSCGNCSLGDAFRCDGCPQGFLSSLPSMEAANTRVSGTTTLGINHAKTMREAEAELQRLGHEKAMAERDLRLKEHVGAHVKEMDDAKDRLESLRDEQTFELMGGRSTANELMRSQAGK